MHMIKNIAWAKHQVTLHMNQSKFCLDFNCRGGKNEVLKICFAWAVYFAYSSPSVVGLTLWALARPPCAPRTAN
jgi:hypothetical protein